ncbi:MAG: hypothetical protein LBT64_02990, partial [Puniceicoccales bacterium]|nr:hypothetical protein [Puniceicoccales bacterium]
YGIITNIAAYSNKITRNISIDENCSKCSVTCEGRTVSTISSYGSNKLEIDSKTVHVPIVVEQTVACTAPFGKPQNRQLDAGGTSLSIYEGIVKSGDNLIESCNPDHRPPAPEIKKGNLIYKVQAAQASPFFDPESIASMTFGND